jgi:hypothetical protein
MADKKHPHLAEGNGFIDITLAKPTKVNGADQSALRMREPTVADMELHQDGVGSEAAKEVAMFANLCEVAPADIRAMSLRNYKRLQDAFALFTA